MKGASEKNEIFYFFPSRATWPMHKSLDFSDPPCFFANNFYNIWHIWSNPKINHKLEMVGNAAQEVPKTLLFCYGVRCGDIFNVMEVTITATFNHVNPDGPSGYFKCADMFVQLFLSMIGCIFCIHINTNIEWRKYKIKCKENMALKHAPRQC